MGKLQKKCISSWGKKLPDYKLKLWNEENSPMNHPFVIAAYNAGKYAFVADYVRLYALSKEGGIYLDTDMLVLKPFDDLLNQSCFVGFQKFNSIAAGIIGTVANHPYINKLLETYTKINFNLANIEQIAIPIIMTDVAKQIDYNIKSYSPKYFYPFPFEDSIENPNSYRKFIKPESYTVHLWEASWLTDLNAYRAANQTLKKRIIKFLLVIKKRMQK
jgi:mannosyltransferase OCH1-like enzyme